MDLLEQVYVKIDPKGSLLKGVGKTLKDNDYEIKVLNLIDMDNSDVLKIENKIEENKESEKKAI